jgi:hypothetical protein
MFDSKIAGNLLFLIRRCQEVRILFLRARLRALVLSKFVDLQREARLQYHWSAKTYQSLKFCSRFSFK